MIMLISLSAKPAACSCAAASCTDCLDTSGIVGRPVETMIVTFESRATSVPAAGSVPMNWPSGTVSLKVSLRSGTSCSAVIAAAA